MKYVVALLISLFSMNIAFAGCSWKDVECIARFVLSGYDSDITSTREWSSNAGATFGYGNRVWTRVRFDEESVAILRSNIRFGLEIELVLKDVGNTISLDRMETTFPSDGKLVEILSCLTAGPILRMIGILRCIFSIRELFRQMLIIG